jgi:hypothetical protein
MEPECSLPCSQQPAKSEVLVTFQHAVFFLRWGVVSPPPNPQAGRQPVVGCPRLLIQYIRSYPPYLEAVSSIRNLRTRHAVVTRDSLNMAFLVIVTIISVVFGQNIITPKLQLYKRGLKLQCLLHFRNYQIQTILLVTFLYEIHLPEIFQTKGHPRFNECSY